MRIVDPGVGVQVLNKPDVKDRLFNMASEVAVSSPQQLAATMKADRTRLGKVIKDAGIRDE